MWRPAGGRTGGGRPLGQEMGRCSMLYYKDHVYFVIVVWKLLWQLTLNSIYHRKNSTKSFAAIKGKTCRPFNSSGHVSFHIYKLKDPGILMWEMRKPICQTTKTKLHYVRPSQSLLTPSQFNMTCNIPGGMLWDGSGYHHVCAWECVGWMLPYLFPLLTPVLLRLLAGYCCAKVTYFTLSYSLYTIFRNQTLSKILNYAFYSTTTKI